MTDFDYDVQQKKRLAKNAYAKKGGSRSRRVTLAQDNMTRKEIERMHGDVKTYNLRRPIPFAEYKELPEDLKKEYLTDLYTTKRYSAQMIGTAIGVSDATVRVEMRRLGIPTRNKGCKTSGEVTREFYAWLSDEAKPVGQGTPDTHTQTQTENGVNPTLTQPRMPLPLDGTLSFSGTCRDLFQLAQVLFGDRKYAFTLTFNCIKEETDEHVEST